MSTRRRQALSPLAWLCGGALACFLVGILALITADVSYLVGWLWQEPGSWWSALWALIGRDAVLAAIRLSLLSSLLSLGLILVSAVPIGYALSRYRFPGHGLANTLVDMPIVMPPVVVGVSLLALVAVLGDALGRPTWGFQLSSLLGIVLCQYLVAIAYCIRSAKAAFDLVDRELEIVARTLGYGDLRTFWSVSLPLARPGLLAGAIMAWARALGVFGPLMVVVGTGPRVKVMPTALYLELSVGNIECAVALALVMLFLAGIALFIVHQLGQEDALR